MTPLSAFGFADDYYDQKVEWHAALAGLSTVEALRRGLAPGLPTAELAQDLEALATALRVAAERGVEFALVLRLQRDSIQAVSSMELRQGRFW